MATIRITSLTKAEKEHIDALQSAGHPITIKAASRPGYGTFEVASFPLALLPKIASGDGSGLARRPWLFDISEDVIECALSCDDRGNVSIYACFNDQAEDDFETTLPAAAGHDLILQSTPGLENDPYRLGFRLDCETGFRDRDGAPELETVSYSIQEWVSDHATDKDARCVMTAFLLKEGKEAEETKTQLARRFPWEILPKAEAA